MHPPFPVVAARFLKPIRPKLAQSFPNFKTFRLSLSPCSIKAFAIAIAIKKVVCSPFYLKVIFSHFFINVIVWLPRCKFTIDVSGDLLLFSASFIWAKYFFRNPRTILSFKSGNSDLNFRTAALQPVSLAYFAI